MDVERIEPMNSGTTLKTGLGQARAGTGVAPANGVMPRKLRLPGSGNPNRSEISDDCVCTALRMLSRYASNRLDRVLAGHRLTLTEFQLMLTLWEEGPARVHALARRLRLDPAPTGRALARLEERGVVSRPQRWRFSQWVLEPAGAIHLELLEPIWHEVDETLRSDFGPELVAALLRTVNRLPAWAPRQARGWFD